MKLFKKDIPLHTVILIAIAVLGFSINTIATFAPPLQGVQRPLTNEVILSNRGQKVHDFVQKWLYDSIEGFKLVEKLTLTETLRYQKGIGMSGKILAAQDNLGTVRWASLDELNINANGNIVVGNSNIICNQLHKGEIMYAEGQCFKGCDGYNRIPLGYCSECGNNVIDDGIGEDCDDGNLIDTDGCTAGCHVGVGWICKGEPSVCSYCGNGLMEGDEVCDDDNTTSGDGCNNTCTAVEPGYSCIMAGIPCTRKCGNGVIEPLALEVCDDGNRNPISATDFCSTDCKTIKTGYTYIPGIGFVTNWKSIDSGCNNNDVFFEIYGKKYQWAGCNMRGRNLNLNYIYNERIGSLLVDDIKHNYSVDTNYINCDTPGTRGGTNCRSEYAKEKDVGGIVDNIYGSIYLVGNVFSLYDYSQNYVYFSINCPDGWTLPTEEDRNNAEIFYTGSDGYNGDDTGLSKKIKLTLLGGQLNGNLDTFNNFISDPSYNFDNYLDYINLGNINAYVAPYKKKYLTGSLNRGTVGIYYMGLSNCLSGKVHPSAGITKACVYMNIPDNNGVSYNKAAVISYNSDKIHHININLKDTYGGERNVDSLGIQYVAVRCIRRR